MVKNSAIPRPTRYTASTPPMVRPKARMSFIPATLGTTRAPGNAAITPLGAAVFPLVRRQAELGEYAGHVLLHRAARDHELGRDPGVRPALGHQRQHLALPRGQRGQAAALPAGPEQLADYLWVQGGPAVGHPLQRRGELGHVRDPVLE